MPRARLQREWVKCAQLGCENLVERKIKSRYKKQPQYCSHLCSNLDSKGKPKPRIYSGSRKKRKEVIPDGGESISLIKTATLPVGFEDNGGKFAEECNKILNLIENGRAGSIVP